MRGHVTLCYMVVGGNLNSPLNLFISFAKALMEQGFPSDLFLAKDTRASRSNRSENFSCDTLIATVRSSRVSRALYTSPIPPAPMSARISYGPSLAPAAKAMISHDFTPAERHGNG